MGWGARGRRDKDGGALGQTGGGGHVRKGENLRTAVGGKEDRVGGGLGGSMCG